MKKLRLLKTARTIFASLAITAAIFGTVSCSNISSDEEELNSVPSDKIQLRINVNDVARTVFPSLPEADDLTDFTLYAAYYNSGYYNFASWREYEEHGDWQISTLGTWDSLNDLQNATIDVQPAYDNYYWRFYLTAKKGNSLFDGMTAEEVQLSRGTNTSLSFTLKLNDNSEGNGSIALTVDFSEVSVDIIAKVSKAQAQLYAFDEEGNISTAVTKEIFANRETGRTSIALNGTDIPAGTYRAIVKLYEGDAIVAQWLEVVHIATDLTSTGTIKLSLLEDTYTVTYNLGLADGETITFPSSQLVSESATSLPIPQRENHTFLGWYTDASFETALTFPIIADTQVWARWAGATLTAEEAIDAIKALNPAVATLENPAVIKVSGSWTTSELGQIKNILGNSEAFVSLDLSGALGLTTLPNGAFSYCPSIVSIVLPEDITKISDSAFSNTSISTITIPASVTEIGTNVFEYCKNLAEITVAQGNTKFKIVDGCLCTETRVICCPRQNAATSVTLPSSITSIDDYAFQDAKNLTSVVLNEGLLSIGDRAFERTSLESVVIPNSVTEIGESAFREINNSMTVTIGSGVTSIGTQLVCLSLCSAINVSANNSTYKSIDGVLYSKDGKELLIYPYGKEGKNFVIPDSVETIRYGAFDYQAYLENLTLGAKVKLIECYSFFDFSSVTPADEYLWYLYGGSQQNLSYDYVVANGHLYEEGSVATAIRQNSYFYFAKSTDKTFENTIVVSPTTISAFTDSATEVSEETFQVTEFTETLQKKWYKVAVTAGKKYTVYWADQSENPSGFSGGTGLNDIDGMFYIYDYNGTELKSVDHDPTTFTVSASGTALYIYVKPYYQNGTGKCAFRIEEYTDTE